VHSADIAMRNLTRSAHFAAKALEQP
jgi:hypothetical protein